MAPSPLRPRRRELGAGAGDSSLDEVRGVLVTPKHNVSEAPNVQVRCHSSDFQINVSADTVAEVVIRPLE